MNDEFTELSPEGASLNFPDFSPASIARAGIGHNAPPLPELLREETAALAKRRDDLLGACERVPASIVDEVTSGRVADLIKLIIKCGQEAKKDHGVRKAPFLEGGRQVDAAYKAITDPLDRAKTAVEAKQTGYLRAKADAERRAREEEARRQAAEAERQRQEAEAAAAALETEDDLDAAVAAEEAARQAAADAALAEKAAGAKAAELGRVRGEYGSMSSLTTFWDFKDVDRSSIDLDTLRPYLDILAIEKAVRVYVKSGGRKLTGCVIFENTKARSH